MIIDIRIDVQHIAELDPNSFGIFWKAGISASDDSLVATIDSHQFC